MGPSAEQPLIVRANECSTMHVCDVVDEQCHAIEHLHLCCYISTLARVVDHTVELHYKTA